MSANGTWINQHTKLVRGQRRLLHSGDEISLLNPNKTAVAAAAAAAATVAGGAGKGGAGSGREEDDAEKLEVEAATFTFINLNRWVVDGDLENLLFLHPRALLELYPYT